MGKTRPPASRGARNAKKKRSALKQQEASQTGDPSVLLTHSAALLQSGQPEEALAPAQRALGILSPQHQKAAIAALPALSLLGEIHLELGAPDAAREMFQRAADLDPEGLTGSDLEGGGAEKFLWLAQLSQEGGKESIAWFEKGVTVLEREVASMSAAGKGDGEEEVLEDKRNKLQSAFCGMVEVWMTDLSLEAEAETNCESLIARALLVSPTPNPSTLQTLASIRLSQTRLEDARSALTRSLEHWKELPPAHPAVPDFPSRISLVRLLMEAEMEDVALEVVERMVGEDDESVEAWYLGGWCLWLMANKEAEEDEEGEEEESEKRVLKMSSREWLRNCLKLYGLLEYEDERLKEHAQELVGGLEKELGDAEIEDEDDEGWEDEDVNGDEEDEANGNDDDDEDHEMNGT